MNEIAALVKGLYLEDNVKAYENRKQLKKLSEESNKVYSFLNKFAERMDYNNSYIRTRGLILIAANARWDFENRVDQLIDNYLKHITDDKPITARQCIKVLPEIAQFKHDLVDIILEALLSANISKYADNMYPLIAKDIQDAIRKIKIYI